MGPEKGFRRGPQYSAPAAAVEPLAHAPTADPNAIILAFSDTNLRAFRKQHPEGENVVVAQDVGRAFTRSFGDLRVRFESLNAFADAVEVM